MNVVENIDLRASRGLDRALFKALATSDWVREHQHLAITGPTGTGKSWNACALGHKACRDGFSVIYKHAPRSSPTSPRRAARDGSPA